MADKPRMPGVPNPSGIAHSFTAMQKVELPPIERPQFVVNAEQGVASEFHKRLTTWITDFDESLDDAHEVGIRLVTFGQAITFHLEALGYWNPYLISFAGSTEDGNPVELIQHVNQISVLLMKLPRKDLTKPKRKIGFPLPEREHANDE